MATYKIHPGIGIARLGNSDTEFYIAPETPAGLPQECEANGNPRCRPGWPHAGAGHHISRRARGASSGRRRDSRCSSMTTKSPEGRPLKIGDPIEGGGNHGTLVEIQWQVYVANKKACWYEFKETAGRARLSRRTIRGATPMSSISAAG